MNKSISLNNLRSFDRAFRKDNAHLVAMNAVTKNGVLNASRNPDCNLDVLPAFSVELETGKVCNQKHSGRCWMFASLNVMRLELMKKWNLKNVV